MLRYDPEDFEAAHFAAATQFEMGGFGSSVWRAPSLCSLSAFFCKGAYDQCLDNELLLQL